MTVYLWLMLADGNHDYGQFNPPCVCDLTDAGDGPGSTDGGRTCAQVQKHGKVHGGQRWHMPRMSYHVQPLPGVNLEILALDINTIDAGATCAAVPNITWPPAHTLPIIYCTSLLTAELPIGPLRCCPPAFPHAT